MFGFSINRTIKHILRQPRLKSLTVKPVVITRKDIEGTHQNIEYVIESKWYDLDDQGRLINEQED